MLNTLLQQLSSSAAPQTDAATASEATHIGEAGSPHFAQLMKQQEISLPLQAFVADALPKSPEQAIESLPKDHSAKDLTPSGLEKAGLQSELSSLQSAPSTEQILRQVKSATDTEISKVTTPPAVPFVGQESLQQPTQIEPQAAVAPLLLAEQSTLSQPLSPNSGQLAAQPLPNSDAQVNVAESGPLHESIEPEAMLRSGAEPDQSAAASVAAANPAGAVEVTQQAVTETEAGADTSERLDGLQSGVMPPQASEESMSSATAEMPARRTVVPPGPAVDAVTVASPAAISQEVGQESLSADANPAPELESQPLPRDSNRVATNLRSAGASSTVVQAVAQPQVEETVLPTTDSGPVSTDVSADQAVLTNVTANPEANAKQALASGQANSPIAAAPVSSNGVEFPTPLSLSGVAATSDMESALPTQQRFNSVAVQELANQTLAIIRQRGADQAEARLALHPAELGQLDLSIEQDGQRLEISVLVDNEQAKAAVSEQLNQLRERLAESGLKLASLDINLRDQGDRQNNDSNEEADSHATEEHVNISTPGAGKSSESALDLYA